MFQPCLAALSCIPQAKTETKNTHIPTQIQSLDGGHMYQHYLDNMLYTILAQSLNETRSYFASLSYRFFTLIVSKSMS